MSNHLKVTDYQPVNGRRNSVKSTQIDSEAHNDKDLSLPIINDTQSQKVEKGNGSLMNEVTGEELKQENKSTYQTKQFKASELDGDQKYDRAFQKHRRTKIEQIKQERTKWMQKEILVEDADFKVEKEAPKPKSSADW